MAQPGTGASLPTPTQTHVFKTIGDVNIDLDVYLPPDASTEQPVPILLWWHWGGFMGGHRRLIPPHIARAASTHNVCVVAADHRLAPQASLEDILSDAGAALAFARVQLPGLTGGVADGARVGAFGCSAGGWLALLAALYLKESLRVVAALYPQTDPTDPFWASPQTPPKPPGTPPGPIPHALVEQFLDRSGPVATNCTLADPRKLTASYVIQEGILQQVLFPEGSSPASAFVVADLVRALPAGASLAPIYIAHGSADIFVKPDESRRVASALKERDAAGEGDRWVYDEVEGKNHLWDQWDDAEGMEGMWAFVKRWL